MGILRDYWNEQKRRDKELDKLLGPRFEFERKPNEGFSAFKKRYKKNPF